MEDSVATKIAIHRLLADAYRGLTGTEAPEIRVSRHPSADERAILPPYLGEFGFEVRVFLGAVEPWLRNGWLIPARRPELYPPDTAFADPEFFSEIDRLKQRHGGTEVLFGLAFGSSPKPWADFQVDTSRGKTSITIDGADDVFYRKVAMLERTIRHAVKTRYFHPLRLQTPWDYPLTSVHVPWAPALAFPLNSIVPTYRPAAFGAGNISIPAHVGVQLRNIPAKPERNSNIHRVLPLVRAAAAHLDLPIVCYGHPDGTVPVAGIRSTYKLAENLPLLEVELEALAHCKLLFAPETGIANLAGWLQVPTLLESQQLGYEYESLRPFNPRIEVIDYDSPIEGQIDRLLADKVRVPSPENALNPRSFLHPAIGIPAVFRDEFDQ
ncbi:MAG: hypothetical protein WAO95_19335 [Burkholderiales bacterium]